MNSLKNALLTNWKTTVLACAIAALTVVKAANKPTLSAAMMDGQVQTGIALAVLGVVAKDHDK